VVAIGIVSVLVLRRLMRDSISMQSEAIIGIVSVLVLRRLMRDAIRGHPRQSTTITSS